MPLQTVQPADDKALQDIADNLFRSHKVVVITGAGISTSADIPDFRSRDGLYNLIPEQSFPPTPPASNPSTPSIKGKRTFDVFSDDHNPDTPSPKRLAFESNDASTPPSSQSSTSSKRSSLGSSRLRGEDLFSSRVWNSPQSAAVFYRFIASLRQQVYSENTKATATHKFIRALRDGGRLMRCYTQNIDGLEAQAGLCADLSRGKGNKRRFMKKYFEAPLPDNTLGTDHDGGCEVVSLHGDLDKLRCTLCHDLFEWTEEHTSIFLEAAAPKCNTCTQKSEDREATGKRGLCIGALRPNIVLYGEDNPANTAITPLAPFDIASGPDILLVMGTSLKVFGLQKMVRDFAKAVHGSKGGRVIFVNRTRPAESVWEGVIDDYVAMDCDDFVESIHGKRSDLWLRQGDIRLKVEKVTRKRKSIDLSEDAPPPTKKMKIVVEIPALEPGTERPRKTVRKPRAKKQPVSITQEQLGNLIAATKTTPGPGATYAALKAVNALHPHHALLSPLHQAQRPQASPLTNTTFNRMSIEQLLTSPRTPRRPPMSPITPNFSMNTPTRKMSRIFDEVTGHKEREQRQGDAANDENEENARVPLWKLSNQSLGRRLIRSLLGINGSLMN